MADRLIEVGWVLAGELEERELAAIRGARDRVVITLAGLLPEFTWSMPLLQRTRMVQTPVVEPVVLLESAAAEREARRWDFVLVITDADLVAYYHSYALAMPSRALDAAVISLTHVEPGFTEGQEPADFEQRLTRRIALLALHLLGHLAGLSDAPAAPGATPLMAPLRNARDLDGPGTFTAADLETMRGELGAVADLRLEERPETKTLAPLAFHLAVLLHERTKIWAAIRLIGPWKFPLQFARLTIAGFSALLILVITAESWHLGMSQPAPFMAAFSFVVLMVSTVFVLVRQRLLVRRPSKRLTEQVAVTNLAMGLAVLIGMSVTWLLLFAFVFGFSQLLFGPDLARAWAATKAGPPGLERYLVFSAFVATIGIVIGALGASFEAEGYFRHVAYIDEET